MKSFTDILAELNTIEDNVEFVCDTNKAAFIKAYNNTKPSDIRIVKHVHRDIEYSYVVFGEGVHEVYSIKFIEIIPMRYN